jgi:glucose-6-phosphate isomerase
MIALTESQVRIDFSTGSLLGEPVSNVRRTLGDLRGIFANEHARAAMDQSALAYRVEQYQPVPEGTDGGLFFGCTFLEPGVVGNEYFMTKGHFHARIDAAEYYWCIRGEGVLLLMDQNRRCRAEHMNAGSLHYIPGRHAHRVANIGSQTLCFGACWPADAGHDYDTITKFGFSARVVRVNGSPAVMNVEAP